MATRQAPERAPERPRGQRRLLTVVEVAELLSKTPNALYSMRYRGEGPKWVRTSKRGVRYRPEDVDAWIAERVAAATSQAPPAA